MAKDFIRSVFMRYPEGKSRAVTFSYDDGVIEDKKLVEIFDKYGMKATFNLVCDRCYKNGTFTKEEIEEYFLSKGHEVAVHGEYHRPNGNIRSIEGIIDVLNCRLELEQKCGRIVRGMAYPDTGITQFGNLGSYESVKKYLCELDIAYARSLGGDNDSFELPSDFHNWIPTAHHDNPKIMEYIDKFLSIDVSKKAYHARRIPRLFYIWGHSYEFEMNNNWEHIENICAKLANNDDVWYATNIEIYDYVSAYKKLRYSANGRIVYNPTLYTVWFDIDATLYCIKPGETIRIQNEVK